VFQHDYFAYTAILSQQRLIMMNRDQIKGDWKQSTDHVEERRGKLTDDDLGSVIGRVEF
jgi:hypothetical protein